MSSVAVRRLYRPQTDTGKAVSTMTTEKHLYLSTGTSTREAVTGLVRVAPAVCGCGQDLDVCSGSHCPRCGTTLLQAA
jgi:hypothetical protein